MPALSGLRYRHQNAWSKTTSNTLTTPSLTPAIVNDDMRLCGMAIAAPTTASRRLRPENQRASARSSWALDMLDRPLMLRLRASAYSCCFVGPAAPECDRSPPRLPEEMSRVDV
jgi:hypothetical protein